jgi:hypothetical protein
MGFGFVGLMVIEKLGIAVGRHKRNAKFKHGK